jgi:hypothetical protein
LAALGLFANRGAAPPAAEPTAAKGGETLYAVTGDARLTLTALDAMNLRDVEAEPAIALGEGATGSVVASVDGGVLAYYRKSKTVVFDRATGRERVLALDGSHSPVALSPDGRRLVAHVWSSGITPGVTTTWAVVDLATDRVDARVESGDEWWHPSLVDGGAVRLYRLTTPDFDGDREAKGPWPMSIVAHDLIHGSEIGRVEVPGLLGGAWGSGRTWESGGFVEEIQAYRIPGLALSPDGKRLAIVHPDGDALTVVDAESLAIERSIPIAAKRSALDRLVGLLPLEPHGAAAKAEEGSSRSAVFGADGVSLYVWGAESRAEGTLSREGSGLRRVEVGTGDIAATGLDGREIDRVMALGTGLYVALWDPSFALLRLDASSLAERARRHFGRWCSFVSVRR